MRTTHAFAELQVSRAAYLEIYALLAAEAGQVTLPENPETITALRKLLEAKDCAVRAMIFKEQA
jgi:hypothetical protein